MPNENPNSANYTRQQVDFANEMAKFLAKKKGFSLDSKNAYIPRAYLGNIEGIFDALKQGRYQDQAAQGNLELTKRQLNPDYRAPDISTTLGSAGMKAAGRGLSSMWGGLKNAVSPSSSIPPVDKGIETGSLDPGVKAEAPDLGLGEQGVSPNEVGDQFQHTNESPINSAFIRKLIEIESGGNVNAKTGSNRGLGQFGPNEERKYGINDQNRHLPEAQHKAIMMSAEDNREAFKKEFGREPTQGELYVMHQQGTTGGIQLLKNPDQDAVDVIRPYYKTDGIARSAIYGNLPKGSGLTNGPVKAKDFTGFWTSRFDRAAGGNKTDQTPLPGMMRLGGPPIGDATEKTMVPQGDQVAQNVPGYSTTPTVQPKTGQIQGVPGGYQGAVPPARPLESRDQLEARLMNASPEDQQKILEEYKKNSMGDSYKTPGGGNLIVNPAPGGGQPTATHIPGADITLGIGGMNLHMRQNPNGGVDLILPGGGTKNFGTVQDLLEFARQEKAKDTTVIDTAGHQAKHYQEQQETIQAQGEKSKMHLPQLSIIQKLVKDPSFYSGVGSDRILDAKKVLDFMGMDRPSLSQPAAMEVFQKLIASANLAAMEQLRGYGQVRSTDLRWLEQSNASQTNRPEAIAALTDIAKKLHTRSVEIQDLAQEYRDKHGGNLDKGWDKHLSQWTTDNPLFDKNEIDSFKEKLKRTKEGDTTTTDKPAAPKGRTYVPGVGWQ